jgi:FAD:protein FMN transferase
MSTVLPAIAALGTTWFVELFTEVSAETADETYGLVGRFLTDFEATYSRFKPDSALSRLNKTGVLVHPDATTLELLILGQQLFRDTDGIFNLLVGDHLLARGYTANYSFKPRVEPETLHSPLTALTITKERITLTEGHIDLGGYGKGFLIDRLAHFLHEHDIHYFLINGGGDMYATSDHGRPITIYLEHPSEPSTYVSETTIQNQGFAASSTHKRRWHVSGTAYSHIIDTAPTDEAVTMDDFGIYTKAPTAVLADAWATTLLITKPDQHRETLTAAKIKFARFNTRASTLETSPGF